jgi:hypothetical protein
MAEPAVAFMGEKIMERVISLFPEYSSKRMQMGLRSDAIC